MLILGNDYKFTNIDIAKLRKKYKLFFIPCNKSLPFDKVEKNLIKHIPVNKDKIVILNTQTYKAELINYLKKLNQNKIIDKKYFLEKYLNKIYLSKNTVLEINTYTKRQYFQKRMVDLTISIPLAILAFPLIVYSIYRIKKESPKGSPIFKQIRVGKGGKPFTCYKLRSMHTDINYFNKYTQNDDPRIFKYGQTMRKMRIDELPQLINVIKGDMHLIGPRAEWIDLVKEYEKKLPNYYLRHKVAPGITGWAQVNYPYGQNLEDTRQKLMYDLYYIKHWSIFLELKTIFKTIYIVLGKKGI